MTSQDDHDRFQDSELTADQTEPATDADLLQNQLTDPEGQDTANPSQHHDRMSLEPLRAYDQALSAWSTQRFDDITVGVLSDQDVHHDHLKLAQLKIEQEREALNLKLNLQARIMQQDHHRSMLGLIATFSTVLVALGCSTALGITGHETLAIVIVSLSAMVVGVIYRSGSEPKIRQQGDSYSKNDDPDRPEG